jgi:hypothetical protein
MLKSRRSPHHLLNCYCDFKILLLLLMVTCCADSPLDALVQAANGSKTNEDVDAIDPSEAGREDKVYDDPPTLCSHAMRYCMLFRKFNNSQDGTTSYCNPGSARFVTASTAETAVGYQQAEQNSWQANPAAQQNSGYADKRDRSACRVQRPLPSYCTLPITCTLPVLALHYTVLNARTNHVLMHYGLFDNTGTFCHLPGYPQY